MGQFFQKKCQKTAKPPFLSAFLKSPSKFNCYFTLKSVVATIQLDAATFPVEMLLQLLVHVGGAADAALALAAPYN